MQFADFNEALLGSCHLPGIFPIFSDLGKGEGQMTVSSSKGFLEIRFEWIAGSMPPPHHYEYTIEINCEGTGKIIYIPDYEFPTVPVWEEQFLVGKEGISKINELIKSHKILKTKIKKKENRSIGGSMKYLTIIFEDESINFPPDMENHEIIDPVCEVIKGLVPGKIYDTLNEKRHNYIKEKY